MTDSSVKIETAEPHYPALMFLVRHGHELAALCGLFVFLIGLWFVLDGRAAAGALIASAIGGLIVYLLMRVLWDIARLLADTMIPK